MELTRYDRERLGRITGFVALAGHAVPAFLLAKMFLGLPIEGGGLLLGPLLGFPLGIAAVCLAYGAILLCTSLRQVSVAGLMVVLAADGILLAFGFRPAWLVAGAVVAAASLGLFASLIEWRPGGSRVPGDQAFFVALFGMLAAFTGVFVMVTGYNRLTP